jgi:hypothetical protein
VLLFHLYACDYVLASAAGATDAAYTDLIAQITKRHRDAQSEGALLQVHGVLVPLVAFYQGPGGDQC